MTITPRPRQFPARPGDPARPRSLRLPLGAALLLALPALAAGCSGGSAGPGGDASANGNHTESDAGPPVIGDLGMVDWSLAGYPGGIPDLTEDLIEATGAGAACDGTSDDAAALQAIIDAAPDPAVILLPAGTCRIASPLRLRTGVVLRGRGSEASTLECESAEGCLEVLGAPAGDYVAITDGLDQGSDRIVVADPSGFSVGGGAQLQQEDIIPAEAEWGTDAVGQSVLVTAIEGNTLTITPPLHLNYLPTHHPEIRPVDFVERVGVEDLRILRVDAGGSDASNVTLRRATKSWLRRVESDFTEKYHVSLSESVFVEIRDSYFHRAKSRGDGGQGYGVSLARHATSILVENNIFYETRHAMIVQIGTSGCVFGYNYAERNFSDDGWDKTAISLHGHYSFMDLYESNIVGWVGVGDYWGPAGPGNTFFRNRVLGTDRHEAFGDSRGIDLNEYHGTQVLIGNEVGGEGIYGDLSDVVLHGNNVQGTVTWDPAQPDHTLPSSFYRATKPAFYGAMDWPSLGGDLSFGAGTLPALERWSSGAPVPQP